MGGLDASLGRGARRKLLAVLIMDRSASMARFGDVPLRVINRHLERMQAAEYAALQEVSVVVFDHATDTLMPMQPLVHARPLRPYSLGQGTRLHGTVADVLERLTSQVIEEQSRGVEVSVSVVVFTDGEDRSKPAGKHLARLRRAVMQAGDLGFQLIAVGIGIDGVRLAQELWFPEKLAKTTDPDGVEIIKAAEEVSELMQDFSSSFVAGQLPKVPK